MSTADEIRDLAVPLRSDEDLDPLLERIGDTPHVLIGEASHGTHEFYLWRAALTRRLISEKGFNFVAVEGDWPDCYRVHRSVTEGTEDPADALAAFERWPTWMWANEDVLAFTHWLQKHNEHLPWERRVGFYGLDVYSLWESLDATLAYLREHEPEHLDAVHTALHCFEPYAKDPQAYARATRLVPRDCEDEVIALLRDMAARNAERAAVSGERGPGADTRRHDEIVRREAQFNAEQNAEVAVGAEAYYRAMVGGGPTSWNLRDRHMAGTLDRLIDLYHERTDGEPVKTVVWEHNTHIGDARFTDMSSAGMVNVGQLARDKYSERNVVLVGFGTYTGTVTAAPQWGAPTETMPVPPARAGSTEALMHEAIPDPAALLVFPKELPTWLREVRDHRAIGVVYHHEAERWGNYVETVLGRRYDAFCWIDHTQALTPIVATRNLAPDPDDAEMATWPHAT